MDSLFTTPLLDYALHVAIAVTAVAACMALVLVLDADG